MKFALLASCLIGGSLGFQWNARDDSLHLAARGNGATPYVVVQTITNWVCTTYTSTVTGLAEGKSQ